MTPFLAPLALSGLLLAIAPSQAETLPASASPAATGLTMVEPIRLRQAIEEAETALQGRALEAEQDFRSGRAIYDITVVRDSKAFSVTVDARTGEVIKTRRDWIESASLQWLSSSRLTAATAGERRLGALVEAVEKQTAGRVQEVSLDSIAGRTYVEMDVVINGVRREVVADPRSGTMMFGELD